MFSTVHGAGRLMSRTAAAGRMRRRGNRWEQVRPGRVDWPAVQARLRAQGIVLVGGGADEAPEVYKRLPDVLRAHAGSIRVTHTLRPLGVAMAGEIASSSTRIRSFGVGPNITMDLGTDSLEYARAECELIARALGLEPVDIQQVLD